MGDGKFGDLEIGTQVRGYEKSKIVFNHCTAVHCLLCVIVHFVPWS